MRQTLRLFSNGMQQIKDDGMLILLIPAPFLAAFGFCFVLPAANDLLQNVSFSFAPWYGLTDAFVCVLPPYMTALICAFLLLDERDGQTGLYYMITPVGNKSYLTARIALPMLWGLISSLICSSFMIGGSDVLSRVFAAFLSALSGVAYALMIASVAGNRVEGLAISKISGISLLGIIFAWFLPGEFLFAGFILPSFWVANIIKDGLSFAGCFGGLLSCFAWIFFFYRLFKRKGY